MQRYEDTITNVCWAAQLEAGTTKKYNMIIICAKLKLYDYVCFRLRVCLCACVRAYVLIAMYVVCVCVWVYLLAATGPCV